MKMEFSTTKLIMRSFFNVTITLTFNSTNASVLFDFDDGNRISIFENGRIITFLKTTLNNFIQ
jgi:hypothetical protein